jgi:hypothetical protein
MRGYTKIYIDGEWIQPSGGQVLNVINAATEQPADEITLAPDHAEHHHPRITRRS